MLSTNPKPPPEISENTYDYVNDTSWAGWNAGPTFAYTTSFAHEDDHKACPKQHPALFNSRQALLSSSSTSLFSVRLGLGHHFISRRPNLRCHFAIFSGNYCTSHASPSIMPKRLLSSNIFPLCQDDVGVGECIKQYIYLRRIGQRKIQSTVFSHNNDNPTVREQFWDIFKCLMFSFETTWVSCMYGVEHTHHPSLSPEYPVLPLTKHICQIG